MDGKASSHPRHNSRVAPSSHRLERGPPGPHMFLGNLPTTKNGCPIPAQRPTTENGCRVPPVPSFWGPGKTTNLKRAVAARTASRREAPKIAQGEALGQSPQTTRRPGGGGTAHTRPITKKAHRLQPVRLPPQTSTNPSPFAHNYPAPAHNGPRCKAQTKSPSTWNRAPGT
jgi:hypothetical protein